MSYSHCACRGSGSAVAAGFACEVQGDLGGLDFACVGVVGEFGDSHVVVVAGLVFHVREDVGGILAEDRVECDERLEDVAPLELIEAAHAVENCGEGRLFDRREWAGSEGFVGAIEDVFELRELEGLGEDGDLFEKEGVALLSLLDVDGEGLGDQMPFAATR